MGIAEFFQEAPEVITQAGSSLSKSIPILIIILLIIGILYWIRSLQKAGRTEIRVYKRP